MIKSYIKILIYTVLCVSLQVLIIDKIHLFRIVIPFLYLYVIVKIPMNVTRSKVIAISFLLGLIMDIFFNTLGLHAAACTLAGMFRNPLIQAFSSKKPSDENTPSFQTLGLTSFMRYVLCVVAIHHIALFCIESIALFDPVFLLLRIVACVVLTTLFIFIVEAFHRERKKGAA